MKLSFASKTQPDWVTLAKVIPDNILDQGSTDTRGYLKVLDKLGFRSWDHVHYSFLCDMDEDQALVICTNTRLRFSADSRDIPVKGMLTGSISEFDHACNIFCKPRQPQELRVFFNAILTFLEYDGVRFQHSKHELKDKTFEIK